MKYLIVVVVALAFCGSTAFAMRPSTSPSVSPMVQVSGRVVDDETGKAIEHFSIEWGWPNPGHEKVNWGGMTDNSSRRPNGKFSSQSGWQKDQKIWARIVAPGYVAQPVTPEILTVPALVLPLEDAMKVQTIKLPEPGKMLIRYEISHGEDPAHVRIEPKTWEMPGWQSIEFVSRPKIPNGGSYLLSNLTPGVYDVT